ncbi:radical SAM/SPASM domain-containing protein [Nitratidesulfovibrio vulgaris]|uniref:Radical SAM domain protein n=1 Tax=Nitratidesulfovibrio vulgaris (strain ATCC 29579 / DSM 644 / CCUG 34227 / NCIMB 8303 / VKM B-1760 / Hildenborough) TaxID=882 RepID=Q726U7_NITV2|nr:radical SAM/SPASM domain-containing protein [Nitratidesulfovibrio vulgaris]AAS97480.1 radical SAM domain protein [Nitratidesulfovibrio vulgaris str. Hildenborough]ADP87923.1 Radical SAM domain protein [Nitratidesulfovibrio vulgaris RCH1]
MTPQPLPRVVNLELTNRCDMGCVFCDHAAMRGTMRMGDMPPERLDAIVDQLLDALAGRRLPEIGMVGLGEPMLNRHLETHLASLARIAPHCDRVTFNSNLVHLDDAKARLMLGSVATACTFSVNAPDREHYRRIMGRDLFERVLANLTGFLEVRRRLRPDFPVGVQIMEQQGGEVQKLTARIPADLCEGVSFFVRRLYSKPALVDHVAHSDTPDVRPFDVTEARYPCYELYSKVYIDIDGNLYPCTIGNDCHRAGSGLHIGNVDETPVGALFNGAALAAARARAEADALPFPECAACNIWALTPNNFERTHEGRWTLRPDHRRAFGL